MFKRLINAYGTSTKTAQKLDSAERRVSHSWYSVAQPPGNLVALLLSLADTGRKISVIVIPWETKNNKLIKMELSTIVPFRCTNMGKRWVNNLDWQCSFRIQK